MFTKKNLIFLIGRHLLIALGAVACTAFIIIYVSREITKISDSVVKNKKLAAALAERTTLLGKLKHDAEIVGTNDTLITNAFVPSDNISEFISALESMALKNSITQLFRFDSPVQATIAAPFPLNTVTYNNSLSANLPTFIQYIKDLEKLPYFTKINGFNISSQDPLGLQGVSNVSFNATLYTKAAQ